MKKTIILIAMMLASALITGLLAQDIVYLKNGSIIKGDVIEIVPNRTLKLRTQDGSLYVYAMEEVERIINSENDELDELFEAPRENYLKRGFRGMVDLGIHAGYIDEAEDHYMIMPSFTAGYQINRFLFVGAGLAPTLALYDNDYYTGYRYWDDNFETGFMLPIYGAVRFDFLNYKVSPFLDTRIGYSVTNYCRGFYLHIGVGCRIKKLSISAGYTYQDKEDNFDYDYYDGYRPYHDDDYLGLSFAGVKVGFEF